MARKTFFSFHYEKDNWRAGQVRNSWVTKADRTAAGYWDAAAWEEAKAKGDPAIRRWIDDQLIGTSVTVVLIGKETNGRDYVKYELEQSWKKGNGILGVYIHNLKDINGNSTEQGSNSFGPIFTSSNDNKQYFAERFKTYDWKNDDGYNNIAAWIEQAAKDAGR